MYNLQVKPTAILMAKDDYDWYEEQKLGLEDLFLAELGRAYNRIEKNPITIKS